MTDDAAARQFAEEALRGSRAFFEQIIQSTQEGIAVFDRNLRYVLFNPYMERLTGLSARDVVGAHPAELFPGFDADPVRLVLECALAGRHVHRPDVPFVHPQTGETRWLTDDHTPWIANGEVVGVIATVRDITTRRRSEQALLDNEARMHFALEAARAGVWELNLATRKVTWSPTMFALFGIAPPDFDGTEQGFFNCIVDSDRETLHAAVGRPVRAVAELSVEFRVAWPDGSVRWHYARARVVADETGHPA